MYGESLWATLTYALHARSAGCSWSAGILAAIGFGICAFVFDSSAGLFEKFIVGAIYLGLAGLFLSVLRQRLIERKTDKYKDVEI